MTRANNAYADSEIAITLRLVGTTVVSYSDTTDDNTALNERLPALSRENPHACFRAHVGDAFETRPVCSMNSSIGRQIILLSSLCFILNRRQVL